MLVSERLKFIPLHLDHLDLYFEIVRDPEVMKYIRKTSDTIEDARERLERYTTYSALAPGLGSFALFKKSNDEFIGVGVLIHMELKIECGKVEVGYQFHRKEWGQGYAQEVTRRLLEYGFNDVGLSEIYGTTNPEHVVSQAVLKKCGLRPIGRMDVHEGSEAFIIERTSFSKT